MLDYGYEEVISTRTWAVRSRGEPALGAQLRPPAVKTRKGREASSASLPACRAAEPFFSQRCPENKFYTQQPTRSRFLSFFAFQQSRVCSYGSTPTNRRRPPQGHTPRLGFWSLNSTVSQWCIFISFVRLCFYIPVIHTYPAGFRFTHASFLFVNECLLGVLC